MDIRVGDKCSVSINNILTRHYGICVGHDWRGLPTFIHNSARRGGVAEGSLEDFAQGKPIRVDLRPTPGMELVVVARAREKLGQNYKFVNFNCEHLANYAATGRATSPQVVIGAIAVGVAALGAIAWFFNPPSVGAGRR